MIPFLLFLAISPASLDRALPAPSANYLILDLESHLVTAARWPDMETPVPVGSLVKPFLSLAYAKPFPTLECAGKRMDFVEALAQSCNDYFLSLARQTSSEDLRRVTQKYSIPAPSGTKSETKIGLGDGWKIPPIALARAYAELSRRAGEPAVGTILKGLERGALSGTSSALGPGVLAKTGTAPCTAEMRHAGDGFSLALYPAEAPRFAILVRVHNVPGAQAAETASRLLQILKSGK